MLFNSLIFLYLFLPVTYFVFWKLTSKKHRYIWLTATGYFFYGFWSWKFCFLMLFSTLVSYLAGLGFLRFGKKKALLVIPVALDLLLLVFFKYANFFLDSFFAVYGLMAKEAYSVPHFDVILPVGISFYTFHTISYIVDSYRGVIKPTRNFFEFTCYVSLFSQLVAGPIVRFRDVEKDLDNIQSAEKWNNLEAGISFFLVGLAKKVLIADTIAAFIDPGFKDTGTLTMASAWFFMLGYAYQLYFDFSGYSDMAVGLGRMFGIRIPQNFNSPYKAKDPADFWRRWHISLSTCMRDYLYIPMGGNRGASWQVNRNLMFTMLIGGLWHGANFTFIIWGAYHGSLLLIYRQWGHLYDLIPSGARKAIMFLLVVIGWVPFRMESAEKAFAMWKTMFVPGSISLPAGHVFFLAIIFLCALIAHFFPNSFEMKYRWNSAQKIFYFCLFLISLLVIAGGENSPFLYFQF